MANDAGPDAEVPAADCLATCMQAQSEEDFRAACSEACLAQADAMVCAEACGRAAENRQRYLLGTCTERCTGDADGDGVPDGRDRCPQTGRDLQVDWTGCPDFDGDGVPDERDRCRDSVRGRPVTAEGCPVEARCDEGHCEPMVPRSEDPEVVDRQTEIQVPLTMPEDVRHALIRLALSKVPHPIACPGDRIPPDQPRLIQPPGGIRAIEVGPVSVTFAGGEVVAGPMTTIDLEWAPVVDPCPPVQYSVFIEYYHCHQIGSLVEQTTYWNRGWCRWIPYRYVTQAGTTFSLEIPFGALLYQVHAPFSAELGLNPPADGDYPLTYMPFWMRATVMAHDGNGATSGHGVHADHRYLVLYANGTVPAASLLQIPVAP